MPQAFARFRTTFYLLGLADRKSTRLNSSHSQISYAVFCLKKKKIETLVRTYQDRLYGFALRLIGSRQDAEEANQATFVRAYRALERYPAERRRGLRLGPWP